MKTLTLARVFRVRGVSAGVARGGGWLLAGGVLVALAGCAANCLRDSDCDDAHVCRHDRCELPSSSAPDADVAEDGQGGVPSTPSSTAQGGAGGSATAPDTSSGGSATGGRENLDASPG